MRWTDDGYRYGLISRTLHWAMVGLLAWQFAGMAIKIIVGRAPITSFFVGTHVNVGTALLILIVIRALWGLYNLRRRPPHGAGFWGKAALIGHLALYALMLAVPTLAFVRALGGRRPFSPFGVSLTEGRPADIAWMTEPANAVHGLLAWVLLAAIAGHILMVLVHTFIWKDATARRMLGRV